MEGVVAALLQVYVYGIVPPVAEVVAPPFEPSMQVIVESITVVAINNIGSVTVEEFVEVHPFASVIVTVYVPATILEIEAVVAALLQA
jgi:hypothetical protein